MVKINFLITLDQGETFSHLSVLSAIRRGLSKASQTTRVNGTLAADYLVQHYQAKTAQFPNYTFDINLALLLVETGSATAVSGKVLTVDHGAVTVHLVRGEAGYSLVVARDNSVYYWLSRSVLSGNVKGFARRLADSIAFYEQSRRAPRPTSTLYKVEGSSLELNEVWEILGMDSPLPETPDIEIRA